MGARLLLPLAVYLLLRAILISTETSEDFIEQSSNITIRAGNNTTIQCRTQSEISSCVWLWEFPGRDRLPTVVAAFPGHGPGAMDCSLNLVNVSQIQTGWWTCRAQTINSTILHSQPVFLQVFTSPTITFELKPVNRTFSIGGQAELECKTSIPVVSCQWSFQQKGQTEPLVVTEGPPHDSRDCSFKLEHVSYEQVGAWKCGARVDDSDGFTYTETVYIQVEHKEEAFPVEFVEEPEDTEMVIRETGKLQCRVREEAHIEDCRWYWQPIGHSKAWKVLMREFLPVNNDCSIQFANVTADPEGLWTCHVKPIHSKKFKASKSAKLTVRGEVAVATLTREVSVSEGEPLTLHCKAEQSAKGCQWKRKVLFETDSADANAWTVMKVFPSYGVESRDCSLKLEHSYAEHQGLWVCSIRLQDDQPFKDAMPTAVTVKPPMTVRFDEEWRTQLAAEGRPFTLNCSTHSAVRQCLWMWYEDESKVAQRIVKFNFTTESRSNRNCSIQIPKVERSMQGIWQCVVKYGDPSAANTSYARPFSLTVVKTAAVMFREVSLSVVSDSEGTGMLECVTREPVQQCVWLYQENLTSPAEQFTTFQPTNFNNCSLREDSEGVGGRGLAAGWWTCGAQGPGDANYTMATPIRLDFIKPGHVTTKSLISGNDVLVLVCQMSVINPAVSCDWIHPSEYNIFEFNETGKYIVDHSAETGVCSLSFRPMLVDVGHWKCVFSVNNKNNNVGEASFTVLSSPQNVRLSWIVGILATVTLMLTVLLFVVVACRLCQCVRSNTATVQLSRPLPEHNKRYSDDPTKGINFSFTESPELLVDFSLPSQENHHYERVGRFSPQRPSFYQNVD